MKKPNGIVVWEGKSVLDDAPIALIATLKTANRKTGDMVQTWIIRTDMDPVTASKMVLDASICGACPHRQSLGGACYVNIGQAPRSVYAAYKRGSYPSLVDMPELSKYLKNRNIRAGAYGDPAAVPVEAWATLRDLARGWTGYTHQLSHPNFDARILDYVMVSADTPRAAMKAHSRGLRTFRVATVDAPLLPNEIICPSETDGLSCAECKLCSGANTQGVNVVIPVHGTLASRYTEKYNKANLIAVG